MVAPVIKNPVDETGKTATDTIAYTAAAKVSGVDAFGLIIINGGSTYDINYSVQVSPDTGPSPSTWSNWIAATTLGEGASFSQSYATEAWRWVRIGYIRAEANDADTLSFHITTRTEKVM